MNICRDTLGSPSRCQQTELCIGTSPRPHTPKIPNFAFVPLHPCEGDRLVNEPPPPDKLPTLAQFRHGDPKKQNAVIGSNIRDWQTLKPFMGRDSIFATRSAITCQSFISVLPGRIHVNYLILLIGKFHRAALSGYENRHYRNPVSPVPYWISGLISSHFIVRKVTSTMLHRPRLHILPSGSL